MHPIFDWTINLCNQFHNSLPQHSPLIINPHIYPHNTHPLYQNSNLMRGLKPTQFFFGFLEFGFWLYGICRDVKSDEGVV